MIIYGPYKPSAVTRTGGATQAAPAQPGALNFHDVLRRETQVRQTPSPVGEGLRFSKHAEERLEQRGIQLETPDLERLNGAVDKAASKGSSSAVVLMDDVAFIVSVAPKTVVTVMEVEQMREHVISNIDSFVWAGP